MCFVVCFGYIESLKEECVLLFVFGHIHSLKEECVLLFVLVISRVCRKSELCCLLWSYTETERGVCFVVCFGHIQSLKEECVSLFVLVIYRA